MKENRVFELINSFYQDFTKPISLHEPVFSGNEWKYVQECLDTGWVSSVGMYVDKFEEDLARFTGAKHAVVTTNGTCALHLSFLLAGVQQGDEVLMPGLTFVATANAAAYCGAIPHFVDIDPLTLGVDPIALKEYLMISTEERDGVCFNKNTNRPIRSLCVMHTFGHPVDLDPILALCQQFKFSLIEDAAEALGSYYKGKHLGAFGLCGALSFNGNKIITTGGGGAILTNDPVLAKKAKHLSTTAKQSHPWEYIHDNVGYNYRMPNINAALGCAQLEQLPRFLSVKRSLAVELKNYFSACSEASFIQEPSYAHSNYWLNALRLEDQRTLQPLLEKLHQNGIYARPVWELLPHLKMYKNCPSMVLDCSEDIARKIINLPSSVFLGGSKKTEPLLQS